MLNVKIFPGALREQPYTDKKDGSRKVLHFQTAWVSTVDRDGTPSPFPEKVEFIPERDAHGAPSPYAAGDYTLHPSAVYIDRDGRLAATLRLTPLPAKPAASATR